MRMCPVLISPDSGGGFSIVSMVTSCALHDVTPADMGLTEFAIVVGLWQSEI